MAPLDTAGVWTVGDMREQEPGLHLVHNLKTVTNQVRQSFYSRPLGLFCGFRYDFHKMIRKINVIEEKLSKEKEI